MSHSDGTESLPECAKGGVEAVDLFGMTINRVSVDEAFDVIDRRIADRKPGYIVTPNVDHICCIQTDEEFRNAYKNAFLVLPDGVTLMWGSRLVGKPLRQKISGSDLIYWLTEHAAKQGHSVFFLGASEGVADEAARRLAERFRGLKVAGTYSPPLGFDQNLAESENAIRRVREAAPDICYVALGSPLQENWLSRHRHEGNAMVSIGVGAALDFVAGRKKRAPLWIQKCGLEWTWRLCQEPRRLWKRYLIRDVRFIGLTWREFRSGVRNRTKDYR